MESVMCRGNRVPLNAVSRRRLVAGAAVLLAASALAPFARAQTPPENRMTPAQALERLMQGNARYAEGEPDFSAATVDQSETRLPFAAVLACSDEPLPAELLFDQAPGDLFVVRDAGNVVTDTSLASLEYAVQYLNVPLLLVLGHSNCGAVGAAFDAVRSRKDLPGHLPDLVKAIEPAVVAAHARHPSDFLAATIEENVRLNVKRLIEAEPVLTEALAAKKIAVSGGVHDLAQGTVKLI
jgi:carbonic anhydrase